MFKFAGSLMTMNRSATHSLYRLLILIILVSFSETMMAQVFITSNLPIIIISTNNVPIPDEPKIPGTMKIIDNGPGQINHVTDSGNIYTGNIGIEIRGHYSASLPQKPYAIETRDVDQNELNVPLFGFPEEHDWVLLANYNDKVFMRNVLAFKLFNEMGHYASRTRFCEVMVNGAYQGIYIFGEKIKRDNGRVDIAKLETNENSGEPMTGGYIFKLDYWDWTNSWLSAYHPIGHSNFDVHFVYEYPKPENITLQQKAYIKSYVNTFESALYDPYIHDSTAGYYRYMDMTSFIDYFLVNEVSRNNDGFKKSFFMYKNRDGIDKRINLGPVWDFDWAWKNINECYIFAHTDGSGWAYQVNDCYPDVHSSGWHIRLLQDTIFANALKCRYDYFRTNILNADTLFTWIDSTVAYLWEAQQRHYERWPILGLNVGTPVVGPIPTTFEGEIEGFKFWIQQRLCWLDANMPGHCYDYTSAPLADNKPGIQLFPNPASDYVFIELPAYSPSASVYLSNIEGRRINPPVSFDGNLFTINVSGLAPGIYMASIAESNHRINHLKFVVTR
jgi:hypothetical protein